MKLNFVSLLREKHKTSKLRLSQVISTAADYYRFGWLLSADLIWFAAIEPRDFSGVSIRQFAGKIERGRREQMMRARHGNPSRDRFFQKAECTTMAVVSAESLLDREAAVVELLDDLPYRVFRYVVLRHEADRLSHQGSDKIAQPIAAGGGYDHVASRLE